MNEIDQILLNIDKDDDDKFFHGNESEAKRNDELSQLIESLDDKIARNETGQDGEPAETKEPVKPGPGHAEPHDTVPEAEEETDAKAYEAVAGVKFTLRGTKNWNRREPYIIAVDAAGYRNDLDSLQKSFFFVEAFSEQEAMKQRIKQEIVAFLRKPSGHVTEQYAGFIFKKISVAAGTLSENFKLDPESEKLFIYHIGPLTVYKYLKDDFYQNKYGYCYKYLPGNKAARFFPDEFIKTTVLKWFEENINTLNLPFDSIQRYEEMKKIASRKYYNDLRTFNTRLEQLNSKLGPEKSISRIKLFQIKGIQWFGHLNIEVYRRFIGGTIFM
ncbi:MAG TPA: hypothetical protein PLM53_04125 [Spirochaetota bacterium]|nr:hypothetical protein [Spirochaetota bacterium]HPC41812.1 hypothetical protein [Spirochaetota bacterium]HPL16150.1 hypothetical protein [Spirochaetota bacterium]HQF07533.1 hypothetical protein [Spirochaetota bacterium]HQH96264.1 hypothetical protein [Spirochaetota bacterium]